MRFQPATDFEEISTKAIVLRVHASGEADLVATLLTEMLGKVSVIAKRARARGKKFSSSLDIFDYGQFSLRASHGKLLRLEQFHSSGSLIQLRDNIDKFIAASTFLESCCRLCEGLHSEGLRPQSYLEPSAQPAATQDAARVLDLVHLCLVSIAQSSSLKETMRALCLGMDGLCTLNGYVGLTLDTSNQRNHLSNAAPSLHLLQANLRIVEELQGKPLSTRASLELSFNKLRKQERTKIAN
jgi:hypothetical protein